jgi:hypothetical protein
MFRRLLVLAVVFASLTGSARAADRTAVFVAALKRSPVFVSDLIPRRMGPAAQAQLRREVQAMPFPTFVVVAPNLSDEPGVVLGEDRLALLRDQLGEDGLYVVSDDRGSLDVAAFGVQPKLRAHEIGIDTYYDLDRDRPTIDKLRYALALARGEPRLPKAQRAVIPESEGGPAPTPYPDSEDDGDGVNVAAVAVFLAGAAFSAGGLERRRRVRRARGRRRPTSLPSRNVHAQATAASARLATAIDSASSPSERALELAAAASLALERPAPIDQLGALVLAERGREALRGRERERCFFDPRHPGPVKTTRWRGDQGTIDVPACKRCAKAIAAEEAPPALFDRDRPYWQRDTVWARTGFGALRRDMRRALLEDRR